MTASSWHGLLVIDKPAGMTSRDALNRVQTWFPRGTRIGHTGTLDPLATGVLVVCVGMATRLADYVQRMTKTYRAGLLLGARSDSDDADGKIEAVTVHEPPREVQVLDALKAFIGEIDQVPPAFSAAKVMGRRAYDLARQEREVKLEPRRVRINGIDLLRYRYPILEIDVRCGKGTYIRSLARDLGTRLGCGALVNSLRRTRVGPFDAEAALSLQCDMATARSAFLSLSAAVSELPALVLGDADATRFCRGQRVTVSKDLEAKDGEFAVFDRSGELVGIAVRAAGMFSPRIVFHAGGRIRNPS